MDVANAIEEDGEDPQNNEDQQGEVEQAAGKGGMAEDDLMKLISPVSAMIQGERPIVSWFSIRLPQKIEIRILQGSSGGQKASEISLSPSGAPLAPVGMYKAPETVGERQRSSRFTP